MTVLPLSATVIVGRLLALDAPAAPVPIVVNTSTDETVSTPAAAKRALHLCMPCSSLVFREPVARVTSRP